MFSTDGIPPIFGSQLVVSVLGLFTFLILYVYKNVTSLRARSCSSWFLVVSLMPIIVLDVPLLVVCWRGKVCVCV